MAFNFLCGEDAASDDDVAYQEIKND